MRHLCLLALLVSVSAPGLCQVVVIALDPKPELVDGELKIVRKRAEDSVVVYDFNGSAPAQLGQVRLPTSFQGPPNGIAVSTDASLALVGAATKIDPADPLQLIPDDRLSVVDLKSTPIRVIQTLVLPAAPAAVAINPAGTVALVTHPDGDKITLLAITGKRVAIVETIPFEKGARPSAVAFAQNGTRALVTFAGNNRVALFVVKENNLQIPAILEMSAGVFPSSLSLCGKTGLVMVSNYGKVTGDMDTVSLINLEGASPRVIDTISVGPSPEGIACSADGKYVGVSVQNMSTVARTGRFYSPSSKLVLLEIENQRLRPVTETEIGGWAQGVDFLSDSRTLFVQSMNDRSLRVFKIVGRRLKIAAPAIVFSDGAPAAYGIQGR